MVRGDSELEGTYLKGQYLPFGKERETIALGDFGEQIKFVVPANRADKFLIQWQKLPEVTRKIVSVSASRVFDDKDGKPLRYVIVSHCPHDICEAIHEKLVGDLIRLQKYQQEQLDAERAERDAAHETGEDAPEGRVVITGTVLAFKRQESIYGDVLKMLVQDDRVSVCGVPFPQALRMQNGRAALLLPQRSLCQTKTQSLGFSSDLRKLKSSLMKRSHKRLLQKDKDYGEVF